MVDENAAGPMDQNRDLPAVSPPSASFFVSLFLLPALIVAGIALVYFVFGKLAQRHSVEELLQIAASDRADRWKAAHDLSYLLREETKYAHDSNLAQQLSSLLEQTLAAGKEKDELFAEYLCGALGIFEVQAGMDALIDASGSGQPSRIRHASLLALARRCERRAGIDDERLVASVVPLLSDSDADIREVTALLLGFVDDPGAAKALEASVDDPKPTVRYNVASALASHENPKAIPICFEMLSEKSLEATLRFDAPSGNVEPDTPLIVATMLNGFAAVRKLVDQLAPAQKEEAIRLLEPLANHSNAKIKIEAAELLVGLRASLGAAHGRQ